MALKKDVKKKIVKKFAQDKSDTGSPEVQLGLLSAGIKELQGHLDEHGHDSSAKMAILTKIAKRRRLLRYLVSRDSERYKKVIKELGLKK